MCSGGAQMSVAVDTVAAHEQRSALHFVPPSAAADPVNSTAVVLEVVDGDTIDLRDDNRGHLRVRVLGIDTPETKKPGRGRSGPRRLGPLRP